jgi:polyferredoxin
MALVTTAQAEFLPRPQSKFAGRLKAVGDTLQHNRRVILGIQWTVVVFYLALVAIPAFLPLPAQDAHVYDNLTLFAQFVFWGIWWPFVMLSMMLMGRIWCGVFCPEGTLTEYVSRHGLGRKIPKWVRWGGWPFVAFAITTIYGQLVSVYDYAKATLLVLGGSTVAAVAIGFVYGGGKRVWCRYLCPANGLFRLLARLAPVHFRTDAKAWREAASRTRAVDCAPLVDVRHLSSMADCHACGRCSGHRNAVSLEARSPNSEVMSLRGRDISRSEVLLLVYGVLGIALGAFQWSASPWFVTLKQYVATWLVEHDHMALLADNAPWWLLTHYRDANDVFTWLDGLLILFYIGVTALVVGSWILLCLRAAAAILRAPEWQWRLAYSLVPLAGVTVFLGLSLLTVAILRADGLMFSWITSARVALLLVGFLWSTWVAWRILRVDGDLRRRVLACGATMVAMAPVVAAFSIQFLMW